MTTKDIQIKTDRLKLRTAHSADVSWIRPLADNYNIAKNLSSMPHPYDDKAANEFAKKLDEMAHAEEHHVFAILSDAPVGIIGLHERDKKGWELGYWLGEPYWNKGFATEAANAIVRFAFTTLELDRLWAGYAFDNPASARVLEKSGFRHLDKSESHGCVARGMDIDCHLLDYHRSDWLTDQGKNNT